MGYDQFDDWLKISDYSGRHPVFHRKAAAVENAKLYNPVNVPSDMAVI